MAKSLGIRNKIKRTGEKFAYAVSVAEGKSGVAYCLSDEATARFYVENGGRYRFSGLPKNPTAFGRGDTCVAAKKAALKALKASKQSLRGINTSTCKNPVMVCPPLAYENNGTCTNVDTKRLVRPIARCPEKPMNAKDKKARAKFMEG